LALCEPPGWDLSPTERLGRQHATLNAMRLWSLMDQTLRQFLKPIETVTICAPASLWSWPRGRFMRASERSDVFTVEIKSALESMRLQIQVQSEPSLVRALSMREISTQTCAGAWETKPALIPMAYPQARAFLAALTFSVDADRLFVGSENLAQEQSR
jgi:hypothetical protein